MADQNTINRIGGLLKNVYSDGIIEQQNMSSVIRRMFSKTTATRMGGDHYEQGARLGGNRAGVGARNSDDALPTPRRQNNQKFLIYDRAVFGVIKLYDKDIENASSNAQAFANHLEEETSGLTRDIMKVMNIDTYMDGSGILTTVNANTNNSNTFVGQTGSTFGQFGTRYIEINDQIDVYDTTLTIPRTPLGGVQVTGVEPTTQTVTTNVALTLTANDVVVRAGTVNKTYIGLQIASDNSSSVTFQGQSRATYAKIRGNVISAGGNALTETYLQQLESQINTASGEDPEVFVSAHAQWDSYLSIGQTLKRFMEAKVLDMGFTAIEYNGKPFIKDVDTPPAAIFAWASKAIENGTVKPLGWLDRDGKVLKFVPGFAAWTAIQAEYGNYIYPRPNKLGRIDTLAVDPNYVR